MRKWFDESIKTIEELRKCYKKLLQEHHPDNGGNVSDMQEINAEYDLLFKLLKAENATGHKSTVKDENVENEAFKEVLERIMHINAGIEIVGSWIWVTNGYPYRELLKSLNFKYASRKKMWCWHYGEYRKSHKGEVDIDTIRNRFGSRTVSRQEKNQYALD